MKDQQHLKWFIGKGLVLIFAYILFRKYGTFMAPVHDALTLHLAQVGSWFMHLLGYDTSYTTLSPGVNIITMAEKPLLHIENGCNGIALMILFTGFMIAYPGPWKQKLWFVPAGLVIIHLVNVLRIVALTWNYVEFKTSFDFNHKYTYMLIIYAVIFALWMFWANRFSGISFTDSEESDKVTVAG